MGFGLTTGLGQIGGWISAGKAAYDQLPNGFVANMLQDETGGFRMPGSGVTIRNASLAGQNHPLTGIPFDQNGFPDFSSVATHTVDIQQTGIRYIDRAAANRAAGLSETGIGYTWHHHRNGTTMQRVPYDIHYKTGHTGGVALGGGG
jgi:hypothetical protein